MGTLIVVNRRLPGEVRGDWAVRKRGGGLISEGHKTKDKAVRVARRKAGRGDTVLVQGTDGKFQRGFSPRKNGRRRGRKQRGGRRKKRVLFGKTNAEKLLKGKKKLR